MRKKSNSLLGWIVVIWLFFMMSLFFWRLFNIPRVTVFDPSRTTQENFIIGTRIPVYFQNQWDELESLIIPIFVLSSLVVGFWKLLEMPPEDFLYGG